MAKRAKRSNKQTSKAKGQTTGTPTKAKAGMDRREALGRLRNGALVVAAVGGVGWYVVSEVRAGIEEGDLTKIGNGIPTIVQIHDPQCPICQALQAEVRNALERFDDGDLQYLVANIRQEKGKQLADQHGVPHVTLLLFDGQGERQEVLSGPNTADNLERVFRQHMEREG